jgi:CheY-like chemotaxis protein
MPDYTILIIDYEPASIEKLRAILEKVGYRVETAADGTTGTDRFNELEPVMAFIEELLPRKTGLDTCRELKATPLGARTPIVILGSRFRGNRAQSAALGHYRGDEYLAKPVTEDDVAALVERFAIPRPTPATREVAASEAEARSDVLESELDDRLDSLLGGLSTEKPSS